MNIRRAIRFCTPLMLSLIVLATSAPVLAQTQSVVVSRRDVNISILTNGDEQFQEDWEVQFRGGPFHFAFRGILLKNLDSVDTFQVSEGARAYQQNNTEAPNTYQVYQDKGQQFVKWFFSPTTNQVRSFTIKYTVHGALRIYPDGDQLYSIAIESDRLYPIESSRVLVTLPTAFSPDQIKNSTYTNTREGPGGRIVDGKTVEFLGGPFPEETQWEVRVQFPHGVVTAAPPAWQAAADQEAAAQAERDKYKPVLDLIFLFLGLVLLLAGPIAVYLLWFVKGRDAPAHVVASTNAPPDNLPAGIVGTLIDEKADMKDIVATIIDLARRGILKMTEKDSPGFLGIGSTREYTFELVGDTNLLRPYELTLVQRVFGGSQTRELSDLKNSFYTAIPTLKEQMYKEVVQLGFYPGNPNTTRTIYAVLGVVTLVMVACIGFVLWGLLSSLSDLAWCPIASLAIAALGLIIASPSMPRRTPKGATERGKWVAFKRYLESIEKFTKLEEAKDLFDKYLPYTIAFGMERTWTQKFAAIGTPAPTWYETYPPIGYGGYPHRRGGYGQPGGIDVGSSGGGSGGQLPSLDRAAGNVFTGLDSMTAGLFTMLDSTASVFTSAPSSSGGGGGGWSGGGGGGGGGSGGGSSGFG